ncbi:MAG: DUF6328 family protein [Solirubrobacteraceae bacterium]
MGSETDDPHAFPQWRFPLGEAGRKQRYSGLAGRERPTRRETHLERLDRNLEEMTGELRVVVTGVQVLFAFLLVVPFNTRACSRRASARSRSLPCGLHFRSGGRGDWMRSTADRCEGAIAHAKVERCEDSCRLCCAWKLYARALSLCRGRTWN